MSSKLFQGAVIKEVPFYSQSWNTGNWKELGFTSEAAARHWEPRSCGVLCLKMAIDYFLSQQGKPLSPPIAIFINRGLAIKNAYDPKPGWIHMGLVQLAKEFGLKAETKDKVRPKDLKKFIDNDSLPLISTSPAFVPSKRSLKQKILFWRKYGGHLALVIGYEELDGEIKGFFMHHTSTRKENDWISKLVPIDIFSQGFTGRCIVVSG